MNGTKGKVKLIARELNHCCERIPWQGTYHRVLTSLACQIRSLKIRVVTLRNFNEWILLCLHETNHGAFKPHLLIRTALLHIFMDGPFYKPKIMGVNHHRTYFSPINSHTCMHTYHLLLVHDLSQLCELLCKQLLQCSMFARQVLQQLVHFLNPFLPQKYNRSKLKTQVFN